MINVENKNKQSKREEEKKRENIFSIIINRITLTMKRRINDYFYAVVLKREEE